jgi:hypothetical protein
MVAILAATFIVMSSNLGRFPSSLTLQSTSLMCFLEEPVDALIPSITLPIGPEKVAVDFARSVRST